MSLALNLSIRMRISPSSPALLTRISWRTVFVFCIAMRSRGASIVVGDKEEDGLGGGDSVYLGHTDWCDSDLGGGFCVRG